MTLPRSPLWARWLPPYLVPAPFCFCISELICKVEVHIEDLMGRQHGTAVVSVLHDLCNVARAPRPSQNPSLSAVLLRMAAGSWIQLQPWY